MLPEAVAWFLSGRVTKSQWEGAVLGVFFPIENALYSIAFGTHTKMGEPIDVYAYTVTEVSERSSKSGPGIKIIFVY